MWGKGGREKGREKRGKGREEGWGSDGEGLKVPQPIQPQMTYLSCMKRVARDVTIAIVVVGCDDIFSKQGVVELLEAYRKRKPAGEKDWGEVMGKKLERGFRKKKLENWF